jgi:hypothetical protein
MELPAGPSTRLPRENVVTMTGLLSAEFTHEMAG